MKRLVKNGKVLVAYISAFAILAVSLLSAFTGVGITALAKSGAAIDQWNGEFDTELAGGGTEGNPYLITSAEELAAVCYGKAAGATSGSYFKVSGVDEFYMDSVTAPATVKGLASAAEVYNHYNAIATAPAIWTPNTKVQLKFDGNGATVYGLYMYNVTYAGLFAIVTENTSIKNIAVKNSYGISSGHSGFIAGQSSWGVSGTVTIENCMVVNNYLWNPIGNAGEIIGHAAATPLTINNCLVADNALYYTSSAPSELPFQYFVRISDVSQNIVTNCVAIDVVPQVRGCAGDYSNNYYYGSVDHSGTDITRGVTELTSVDTAKGVAAATNLSGLGTTNWFFNTTTYPEQRIFHNIELADNGDGTHGYNCDCGLKGIPVEHELVDNECECGYVIKCGDGIAEIWDGRDENGNWIGWTYATFEGSGTANDPYIIRYAEQLAHLTTSSASTYAATVGKYYKVDDSVKAFDMNTTGIDLSSDMTVSEVKAMLADEVVGRTYWTSAVFAGTFDGNGVEIYGLHAGLVTYSGGGSSGAQPAALFPKVAAGTTIKNLTLKNSYLYTSTADSGGLVAIVTADAANAGNAADTVYIENCIVHDCYIGSTNTNVAPGIIAGNVGDKAYVDIDNILVYDNEVANAKNSTTSILGAAYKCYIPEGATSNITKNRLNNSIILDAAPYDAGGSWWFKACDQSIFQNVYFDDTTDITGFGNYGHKNSVLTQLSSADDAFGAAAATNLTGLDKSAWFFNTAGYPQLKAFHDTELGINYADDNYAGHTEACSCGLESPVMAHEYNDAYTCTVCGFVCDHNDEEHYTYEKVEGTDCVTSGTYTKECECGFSDSGSLNDAEGHVFTDIAEEPSKDCKTNGTAAHKYCSVCEKNYATDASATEPLANALTDEALKLPVADHTPDTDESGIIYKASDAGHEIICAVCNTPYGFEAHDADFVQNGATGHSGQCAICKFEVSAQAGHNFNGDNVCDDCEWTCENHNYVNGDVITEGDCTTDKVVATECSICDTAGENNVTTALGHTEGEMVTENEVAADCTISGSHDEVVYCTVCEDEISRETVTDAATGHTEGETVTENEVAADCTTAGSHDEAVYCTVCEYELSRETVTDVATGHTEGETVTENEVAADCTTDGSHDEVVYCTVCEDEISRETVTDAATGHDLEAVAEVAATTEAEGTKAHYACQVCEVLFEDENGETETTADKLVIAKLASVETDKDEDKDDSDTTTDTKEENTANTDNNTESPKTGEGIALAAMIAIMAVALLALIRKLRIV